MQDKLLVLAENQAITAAAVSDFYIDDTVVVNPGHTMTAETRVRTLFTGTAGSTLIVAIEVGTDATFGTKKTLATSAAIPLADLVVGKQILVPIPFNFDNTYTFMRAYFTPSVNFTAGKVDTVIQPSVFTNHD